MTNQLFARSVLALGLAILALRIHGNAQTDASSRPTTANKTQTSRQPAKVIDRAHVSGRQRGGGREQAANSVNIESSAPSPKTNRLGWNMQILASLLKSTAKHVNVGEVIQFDTGNGTMTSADPSIVVKAYNALLKDKPASFAVNTRQFLSVVSHLTGEVSMNYTGQNLVVASGKGRYELTTLSGVQLQTGGKQLARTKLPLKTFYELLAFPASIAEEKKLYNYSGSIQIKPTGDGVTASATDGKRLFSAQAKLSIPEMLIPARAIKALRELNGDDVFVSQDESAIYFEAGSETANVTVMAKKLAKEFPDFSHLMPKNVKVVHKMQGVEMREALQRVAPMLDNEDEAQRIKLEFEAEKLRLTVNGKGTAVDEIANEQVTPDPMFSDESFAVMLNHRYLSDFFALAAGEVKFSAVDKSTPVLFTTESHTFLVATVRS